MRNLGDSVGIATVTTLIARGAQVHHVFLSAHFPELDPAYRQRLAAIEAVIQAKVGTAAAASKAPAILAQTLEQQANALAYIDIFHFLAFLGLASLPLIFLLRKVSRSSEGAAAH
jgi:DHA2 family multidrug resistance protein